MGKKKEMAPEQSSFDTAKIYVWLKGLESKVNSLVREVNVLKNDFSKKNMNLKKEMKVLNEDVLEIKREQTQALQKMDLIIKELKRTAGVEEVATLRKYVDFWNPMNFVTQRDLERFVERKLEEMTHDTSKGAKMTQKNK